MKTSQDTIWQNDTPRQLSRVLCAIDDSAAMQGFLRDVMTQKEIIEISSRLEAAKLLKAGSKYTDITKATGLSSRTVARISEWMQSGNNGYDRALAIIDQHHPHMSPARA